MGEEEQTARTGRDGFATAGDGEAIWYRIDELRGEGGPDRGAVVLVSGLGGDETAWDDVLLSLDGFTVIRLQNRGIGRSAALPSERWSTRDSAEDVIAVLDAAGIARAAVYGHSLGGRIAQWIAADFPERVTRLVLGATTLGDAHGIPRPAAATRAFESGDPQAALALVFTPAYLSAHPEAFARTESVAHSPEQAARQLAMSTAHDGGEAAPRITAPTLIVHGTEDGITDAENARLLHERILHSDLLPLRDARHAYFSERADANAMVAAFLASAER